MSYPHFPAICRAAGLPEPVQEFRFAAPRRWRFDFAWPAHRVALEVEGGVFTRGRHTRGVGAMNDMQKYNAAALDGWRVFRVVPAQLHSVGVSLMQQAIAAVTRGEGRP